VFVNHLNHHKFITFSFMFVSSCSNKQIANNIPVSPQPNSSNTAQHDEDNNSVRMFLRGRPVTFFVPEKRAEGLNYDIAKVQPAPSKKLKLDWVSLDAPRAIPN